MKDCFLNLFLVKIEKNKKKVTLRSLPFLFFVSFFSFQRGLKTYITIAAIIIFTILIHSPSIAGKLSQLKDGNSA